MPLSLAEKAGDDYSREQKTVRELRSIASFSKSNLDDKDLQLFSPQVTTMYSQEMDLLFCAETLLMPSKLTHLGFEPCLVNGGLVLYSYMVSSCSPCSSNGSKIMSVLV